MTVTVPDHIFAAASGQLLLVGGRHWVRGLFDGTAPVRSDVIETFWLNFEARRAWCASHGIRFSHWVFPEMVVLKRHEVPFGGTIRSVFDSAFGGIGRTPQCHYPLEVITNNPSNMLKTDTHYSPVGNLRLADHMAATITGLSDSEHVARSVSAGSTQDGWVGDLGGALYSADWRAAVPSRRHPWRS